MSLNTLKTVNAFQIIKLASGAVLAAVMVLAFVGASSFAQSPSGDKDTATANTLKISPLRTDASANPGEAKTVKVIITNVQDKEVSVRVIENDFVAGDEEGTPAIILDETEYAPSHSLKRFMLPVDNITLGPGESKTVEVQLVVPADAEPGGYFGAIRFAPTNPDEGGQVNASASVASLILFTVNGDAPEKIDVTDFEVQQNNRRKTFFINGDGIVLNTRIKNTGNVQAGPFGKISVLKGKEVVYDTDFNIDTPRDMILPDSARRWNVPLENTSGFGHYTVTATYTYGTKNQTVEMTQSFWVVPRNMIIAAAAGIILIVALVIGIIFYLKRRNSSMYRTFEAKRRR